MNGNGRSSVSPRRFPRLGESVARRRVFWGLVALVVVPALFLAGYGISGLKNQADATEARLRERYLLQARALEQEILARIADENGRVRRELREVPEDALDEALTRLAHGPGLLNGAWRADDPSLPDALRESGERGATSLVAADDGQGMATWATTEVRPGLSVVYRLDRDAIDAVVLPEVVGRLFPAELARYRVLPAVAVPSVEPVSLDRLRRDLAAGMLEETPQVDRAMAPPFDHWRITITSTEGPAPPGAGGYVSVVVALTAMIVLGVTLMGQAVAQQVRLSRLQTDFVSNVSHELRTPLTSIRMFVETLQSGRVTDQEKVDECLAIIAEETDRLSKKIERVLSWARIEAGRRLYDREPMRPRTLVDGALTAFSAQHLVDDLPVEVDVPEDLPLVLCDREAIAEVLLNLLSNAAKYGGSGVHIRVAARPERRFVAFSVADDGPGIPPSERQRIFEKFYRPDLLQSRRAEGSGLGLAIVKAIVQAHRGRVDVDSEVGRGTVFTVRLPRA